MWFSLWCYRQKIVESKARICLILKHISLKISCHLLNHTDYNSWMHWLWVYPILLILLIVGFFPLFRFFLSRKSQKIIQHFGAKVSFFGSVQIQFQGNTFHLMRISNRSSIGIGGSYPVLWMEVEKSNPFLLCPESARKYHSVFSFPKNHVRFEHLGQKWVLVSDQESVRKGWPGLLRNINSEKSLQVLFRAPFSSLQGLSQWHVGGSVFLKRCHMIRYTAVDENVYQQPTELQSIMESMIQLQNQIKSFVP